MQTNRLSYGFSNSGMMHRQGRMYGIYGRELSLAGGARTLKEHERPSQVSFSGEFQADRFGGRLLAWMTWVGLWLATTATPLFIRFATADEVVSGQTQTLSLQQALDEAKERSPTVQKAKAQVDENRWKKNEVIGSGFLPKLSANANHFFNGKYEDMNLSIEGNPVAIPLVYPLTTASFNLTIPVFDGFANVEHLGAASLQQSASEQELAHTEFQLAQDIRLAFYQALAAQQLEDVSLRNVKTLEDHLQETQKLKGGGVATNYDVLRVQVQLTEARSDEADAQDNVTLTRKKLTQLLGLEQDDRRLEGTLPVPNAKEVESVQFDAFPKERTDLQALNLRVEALAKEHSAQSRWYIPKISVGAEYDFYNDLDASVNNTDLFRSAYNVGVFLQWNIFDGGVSVARTRQVAAQRVQAEKASEEAKLQVPYDFDFWKRRYKTNSSRYEAKCLDVQRSEESVRLAKLGQRAGTRTSTEVLDAELDLFRSRAGVVTSQMNSAEALIKLENVLGRKI